MNFRFFAALLVLVSLFAGLARAEVTPENVKAAEVAIKSMRAPELWMKQALAAFKQNQNLGKNKAKIEKAFKADMKKAMPKLVKIIATEQAAIYSDAQLFDILIALKTNYMRQVMAASIDGKPRPKAVDFPDDIALAGNVIKSQPFQAWLQQVSQSPTVIKTMGLSVQFYAKKYAK